jgi:hypothetical protein
METNECSNHVAITRLKALKPMMAQTQKNYGSVTLTPPTKVRILVPQPY